MKKPKFSVGQRVRVWEQEKPAKHVGKVGIIEGVEVGGKKGYLYRVKLDHSKEVLLLPQRFLKPIVLTPSSLLANDFFLPWDVDDPSPRLSSFTGDAYVAGKLLEYLMFYNRVIIPTIDYAIIVPLVHWLGVGLIKELLLSQALSFVRARGFMGYGGNGLGLGMLEIHPKEDDWQVMASYCAAQEAVVLHLSNRLSGLSENTIEALGKLTELCSIDTRLPEFQNKVKRETYKDIVGNEFLAGFFAFRNTNFDHLAGVRGSDVRCFTFEPKPAVAGDEIDTTLRIGMLNLEAYLAEEAGARDMVTDRHFGVLLDTKAKRFQGGAVSQKGFSQLMEIEGIPNISEAVREGTLSPGKLWEVRNRRSAGQFREWFDKIGPKDPIGVTREYVNALRGQGTFASGPMKLLRFIVIQGISLGLGLVAPPEAALASNVAFSGVDAFLVDRIGQGYDPRYFIDDVKHNFFGN
ncbi:MAG: hypothetical protein HY677_05495 [Chloroflexi bacterium]|nr:hypothetical protein [Chloroflexota bacterium]